MAFANETQKFAAKPTATIVGVEALRAALKDVPNAPGIYKMLDANGKILYIGKAKNLFNRVSSYTNINNLNTRILRMVSQVGSVEIVTTQNEAEAFLVEASLIKRFYPRYNVLLKDDKSFPYLRIDTSHPYPRIEKHRGSQNKPGEYFGPFASVGALNETMTLLQKIFLLRPCADTIFKNRSRPCLQYQIKRCSAPCVNYVSKEQYGEQITTARDFLKGRHRDVQDMLAREMEEASAAMEYERAGLLRDRIRALTQVQQEHGLRVMGLKDADVIALARRGNKSVVHVHFFRDGTHFGNQSFHPKHESDETDAEVLAQFLGQFYQAHTPPGEIMLNMSLDEEASNGATSSPLPPCGGSKTASDVLEGGYSSAVLPPTESLKERFDSPARGEWEPVAPPAAEQTTMRVLQEALSIRAHHKVEIWVPRRGDKLTLIENAHANAEAALKRLEMERASVQAHLLRVQALFGLPELPTRIEVYDNSHISGTNAIGAFIVATPEGFDKKSYRTFNIKDVSTEPGDDYAMMREVFRRRFKKIGARPSKTDSESVVEGGVPLPSGERLGEGFASASTVQHKPSPQPSPGGRGSTTVEDPSIPVLILIDGGLGQLNSVLQALAEIEVAGLNLVAIAKGVDRNAGREWFHMPGREPFQLPVNDPVLHYLERLRDEAHRFAIGKHRNKRSKALTISALDDIPGIGATRKRALLQHFGSRADVETATITELEKVAGISKATARSIYDYFHG